MICTDTDLVSEPGQNYFKESQQNTMNNKASSTVPIIYISVGKEI